MALVLFAFIVSPGANAGEYDFGVGAGIQYGALLGGQGSYLFGNNKVRFGLGYAGYALGYERFLSSKYSLGVQYFANQFFVGGALSLNYLVGASRTRGWVLGLDIYRGVDTVESAADIIGGLFDFDNTFDDVRVDEDPENGVSISIGYHF